MFDIGFTEIILVFVVTLLVVGPERLPRIARTAGLWAGKLRGFVTSVKAEVDRELATEELRKALEKQAAVPELEELIDEVTGEPVRAAERTAVTGAAGNTDADGPEKPPGEQGGKPDRDV